MHGAELSNFDTQQVPDHAYMIDTDYHLVSLDQEATALFPRAQIGDYCFKVIHGLEQTCMDCPWKNRLKDGHERPTTFNILLNAWVNLSCMIFDWPDHDNYILIHALGVKEGIDNKTYLNQPAERDSLTNLYNPHVFFGKAEELINNNPDVTYDVLSVDIEHFKIFNERYGRDAGDVVLKTIAHELFSLRKKYTGVVGYFGGDDFIIILPHDTIAPEKIFNQLSEAINGPDYDIECLPAIGLTTIDDPSVPISTYCDHAMTAMSFVKGSYSSRIAWYEDTMTRQLEEEPRAVLEMEYALKNKEFILHYQPKCNLRTGQIVGLEALVRWQHPARGVVFPGDFIPLLERTGLIANLDLLVWEEACKQLRSWLDRGIPALPISVNVSRADIQFVDVVNSLESLLKKYDLDHSLLELEITESAFVENAETVLNAVINLKDHGFTLLIDDFGSGYSSLNMLKDIPVDVLKIDMRFLDMAENVLFRGESILDAVVGMAHNIGLPVIAEGVETEDHVAFLKSIGCDFAQGYHFYKPLPLETLETLLLQDSLIDHRGTKRHSVKLLNPVDVVKNYVTNKTVLDSILGGMVLYGLSADNTLELIQANNQYFQLVGDNPPSTEEERLSFFLRAPEEVVKEVTALLVKAEKHPTLGAEEEFRQRRADGLYILLKVKAFFLTQENDKKIFLGKVADISKGREQGTAIGS